MFAPSAQENLIQCTEPEQLQVSTKDMDSTLSKASRAIKKTSKKVAAGGGRAAPFQSAPLQAGQLRSGPGPQLCRRPLALMCPGFRVALDLFSTRQEV